ncbi:MAG: phosphatase PAP2 family protein [Anaerolineales bacterium]
MRTQTIDNKSAAKSIPRYERFILILLVIGIQMLYIPSSNQVSGGIELKLPIDIFPILPVWVVPYVLCMPLWLVGIFYATFKMEDRLFRAFLASFFLASLSAVSVFVFFPTYVKAATFPSKDIFSILLQSIHTGAGRYDAFPSGHVYITALLAFFYSRWYPKYRYLWAAIAVIVSLSTIFTGQHYFLDVLGGLAIAILSYHFGFLWAGYSETKVTASK